MSVYGMLLAFSKLSVQPVTSLTRNISTSSSLYFRGTSVLFGEPLKKKKRMDPAVLRNREERKKRKLEKQIRRLEKNSRQLKPISELEPAFKLIDQQAKRTRPKPVHTQEYLEQRILLTKEWSRFKNAQFMEDIRMLDNVMLSQQKALDELRAESEELYQEAIQPDVNLMPHITKGPLNTIAIPNYEKPDGDYIDVTKKYDGEDQIFQQVIDTKKK
ncbi:hypothetical protein HCN44_002737 [Aphidius gifuensis]|uniref:Large ribosomal subunit protein mL40 n=1 Tax=Aphidius gifuensis TaxID=684658 RepID=A0A835CSE4_APHGI|nr:39S ribosomal protein L40, mitochondrial [Aphidius gifuensis]KAF7991175.1 hypothetical protein HCN44_002737 [Aphidius gifuensis]